LDEGTEDCDSYIRTMDYILDQMLPTMCVSLMFLYRHRLSGMDMTLCDYDGRTALHLAAAEGHLECVTFLLEHCHVPYNPKDRSVPSQNARPLLSLLNMEHCNMAHSPKYRSVPSQNARPLLSLLNMEHCNMAHNPTDRSVTTQNARPLLSLLNTELCNMVLNPKDRSVPSQIARSSLSSFLNMEHSMSDCCLCDFLIFLHANIEAFAALYLRISLYWNMTLRHWV